MFRNVFIRHILLKQVRSVPLVPTLVVLVLYYTPFCSTSVAIMRYRTMIILRGMRYGASSWSSSPRLCANSEAILEKGR